MKTSQTKKKNIPGWNSTVKESHEASTDAFLMRKSAGSPRCGPIADLMRKSRALFKYILSACKQQDEQKRADVMANKLINKGNTFSFWKDVKYITNSEVWIR